MEDGGEAEKHGQDESRVRDTMKDRMRGRRRDGVPAVTDVSIISVVLLQAARSAPAKPPATPCDPWLCDFRFVLTSDVRAPLCPSSAFVFPPF